MGRRAVSLWLAAGSAFKCKLRAIAGTWTSKEAGLGVSYDVLAEKAEMLVDVANANFIMMVKRGALTYRIYKSTSYDNSNSSESANFWG